MPTRVQIMACRLFITKQSSRMDLMIRLPNCTDKHQMLIILTNPTSDIGILRLTKLTWFREDCQAIIWTNASILSIRPSGTNFRVILLKIRQVSFKKMHLKMLSAKRRPFCLSLNVLKVAYWIPEHINERHTYLFDCCEVMHHTLIYRIS